MLIRKKAPVSLNNLVAYLVLEFVSDNRHHQRLPKKRQVVQYSQGIATTRGKFLSSSVVFGLLVAELTSVILKLPYLKRLQDIFYITLIFS